MENMFIWMLVVSGALVALLAVFLAAAERELKNKRAEIEQLLSKLENQVADPAAAAAASGESAANRDLAAKLDENRKLHEEVDRLSGELELSRKTNEQSEAARLEGTSAAANAAQLSVANRQLQAEAAELRERLRIGESRSAPPSDRDAVASDRDGQLQSQITELQKKLEASAAKIEELKGAEQKAASVKALEAFHADEEKRFETKIAELEKELTAAEREKLAASASLQERLAQSERETQSLQSERRQQGEEISLWQARIGEAQAQQRRLSSLQSHYDSVLTVHAALAERQSLFQDQLTTFARLLNARVDSAESSAGPAVAKVNGSASPTSTPLATRSAEPEPAVAFPVTPAVLDGDPGYSQSAVSAPARVATAVEVNKKRQHRFGISPMMIGVTIASAIACAAWYGSSDKAEIPTVTASIAPVPAPVAKTERQAQPVENAAVADAAADPTPKETAPIQVAAKPKEPARAPAKETAAPAKAAPAVKSETRVAGIYEITRPSRVYAAPSELSQLIGDVAPGVKVNVVNARDGWLEIHSKYDRPPGYVRKEFAARVGN